MRISVGQFVLVARARKGLRFSRRKGIFDENILIWHHFASGL